MTLWYCSNCGTLLSALLSHENGLYGITSCSCAFEVRIVAVPNSILLIWGEARV
jgi:hypothetical protein